MEPEFTLDAVKLFIIGRGGRVTNHELVKHFSRFLKDPQLKEEARVKFKDFVNTLASVKDENGVKYLVLKSKYWNEADTPGNQAVSHSFSEQDPPPVPLKKKHLSTSERSSKNSQPSDWLSPNSYDIYTARPVSIDTDYRDSNRLERGDSTSTVDSEVWYDAASSIPPTPVKEFPAGVIQENSRNQHTRARGSSESDIFATPYGEPGLPKRTNYHTGSVSNVSNNGDHQRGSYIPYSSEQEKSVGNNKESYRFQSWDDQRDKTPTRVCVGPSSDIYTVVTPMSHSKSSPSLLEDMALSANMPEDIPPPLPKKKGHSGSESLNDAQRQTEMPQPPPRGRKASGKAHERRGSKVEERVRQLTADKLKESISEKNLHDVTVSPGSVKEKAQKINKIASESNLLTRVAMSTSVPTPKKKESRSHKLGSENDDTTSVSTLDPRRKEWLIKSAQGDYQGLVKLLREDQELYKFSDFMSGYTALHWGAKHGDAGIVKLIAGTYQLNPNVKSHGGYTPLHVAAMSSHKQIMDLLENTYKADRSIRDHSGRLAHQYLKEKQQPRKNASHQQRSEKDAGFMRIGSFNTRVKRTAAALTGSFGGQKLKTWGSADNLDTNTQLMPPPKFLVKKKKSKKPQAETTSLNSMESVKSRFSLASTHESDSDSAYGFNP